MILIGRFLLSNYMKEHFDMPERWILTSEEHPKQLDSVSCGIFCLKVDVKQIKISLKVDVT